jgi:hypothetical protein
LQDGNEPKGAVKVVELIGTEKQISWATEIRDYVISEIEAGIKNTELNEKDLTKIEVIKKDMANNQASYWIDIFKPVGSNKLRPIFDYLQDSIGSRKTGNKVCESINRLNGFDNE